MKINIPGRFLEILEGDNSNNNLTVINNAKYVLGQIYLENNMSFFEEYTDHGIRHINSVLKAADEIITDGTFKLLSSNDIFLLVSAIFIHDIAMFMQFSAFKKLVAGENLGIICENIDIKTWTELWDDYIIEAKKFSSKKRFEIFGDENIEIKIPNLDNKDSLTGIDYKLIGEFIRRNHPRIAHEIAVCGIVTEGKKILLFKGDINPELLNLCGLIARSHGMEIRNTFNYIKGIYDNVWKRPNKTNVFFLMVVLRMADYFQIDSERVLKIPFLTKTFKSSISYNEHIKQLQITDIQKTDDDAETINIHAKPSNSVYYVAFEKLFKNIQYELDTSWAVLGQIYGNMNSEEQPKIVYRRIISNICNLNKFKNEVNYYPQEISFTIDKEITKLLVAPLYGNNPSYGVRELLQNSIDACLEREKIDKEYSSDIKIELCSDITNHFFSIVDNGIGMTIDEIKLYFLTIGSCFRKSSEWNQNFVNTSNRSTVRRSGRFGIGVLASYLLGEAITVQTRSYKDEYGYEFTTTLEQEQIEVLKNKNIEIGTKISINIPKSVYLALKFPYEVKLKGDFYEKRQSFYFQSQIKFTDWFALDLPKVTYEIDNEIFKNNKYTTLLSTDDWHIIESDDFSNLKWKYDNTSLELDATIICNGILIPSEYSLQDTFISEYPIISVFDFDAKLPLSLNRNFFTSILPFERELTEDILKHYIFSLLSLNVDFNINFGILKDRKELFLNHPSRKHEQAIFRSDKILYSSDGYTVDNSAFLSKINNYTMIDSFSFSNNRSTESQNINLFFLKGALLRVFNIDGNNFLETTNEEFNIENAEFYEFINSSEFRPDSLIIKKKVKKLLSINKIINGFQCITESDDLIICSSSKNDTLQFYKDITCDLLIIQKIYCKDVDSILSKIILTYLGNDPIIPYELADRKKKYPKAFKELEKYKKQGKYSMSKNIS